MIAEIAEILPIAGVPQPIPFSAHAAASGPDGNIYVSDEVHHRILVLSPRGECLRIMGRPGSGRGEFRYPRGLAFAGPPGAQLLAVCDAWNHRVQLFTAEGEFRGAFGSLGEGRDHFNEPSAVCPCGDGLMTILDRCNHRVKLCTLSGETVALHGSYAPSSFRRLLDDPMRIYSSGEDAAPACERGYCFPQGMALSASGTIIVADTRNRRISLFDPRQKRWRIVELDRAGSEPRGCPEAVTVLPDGRMAVWVRGAAALWLVEGAPPHRIQRLSLPGFAGAGYRPALLPAGPGVLLLDGPGGRLVRCALPGPLPREGAMPPPDMAPNEVRLWFDCLSRPEGSEREAPAVKRFLATLAGRRPAHAAGLAAKELRYLEEARANLAALLELESAEKPSDVLATSRREQLGRTRRAEEAMAEERRLLVQSFALPALLLGALERPFLRANCSDEQDSLRLELAGMMRERREAYDDALIRLRDHLQGGAPADLSPALHACLRLVFRHQDLRCLHAALCRLLPDDGEIARMAEPPPLPEPLRPYGLQYDRLADGFHQVLRTVCLQWGLDKTALELLEGAARGAGPDGRIPYLLEAGKASRARGAGEDALRIFEMIGAESLAGLPDSRRREFCAEKGHALFDLKRYGEALALYAEADSGAADCPFHVILHRGFALEQLGRLDEAVPAYRRALEKAELDADPGEHESAARALASGLNLTGAFGEVLEFIGSMPPALREKEFFAHMTGTCLQRAPQDDGRVLLALKDLIARQPEIAGLRLNLAVRLAMAGDIEGALNAIAEERKGLPPPALAFVRGVCRRIAGNWAEAVSEFTGSDEILAFPPTPLELIVASLACDDREAMEVGLRAFESAARANPALVEFLNVPAHQRKLVEETAAFLEQRAGPGTRKLDLAWLNPSTVRYALKRP